jgi:hypothetical protein
MKRSVWKHFVLVLALLVLYDLASQVNTYLHMRHPDPMPWGAVASALQYRWPWFVFSELPLAAGISLALMELGRAAIRTAMLVAGITLGSMVVFDIWIGPAVNRAEYSAAGDDTWPNLKTPFLTVHDTVGVLGRTAAVLQSRITGYDVQPNWTPPDTTRPEYRGGAFRPIPPRELVRMEAVRTISGLVQFLEPFINCGLVLGLLAWCARNLSFRTRRAKRITLVLASWVVLLFCTGYVHRILQYRMYGMTVGRISLWWIPLAVLPAVALAAFGWRAAARVAHDAEG